MSYIKDEIKEESKPRTLKWSEIGKDDEYKILIGTTRTGELYYYNIPHKEAQQQSYQITNHLANNPVEIEPNDGKTFVISDIHGDIGVLLDALLRSRIVEFVDKDKPCKVIEDIKNPNNKILIPNLKINESCKNKLIIIGDINDRWCLSDSCIMLIKDILDQEKQLIEKAKQNGTEYTKCIIYTVGNHEDMTIRGINHYQITLDNTDYETGNNKDYNTIRYVLKNMVENDEMVFCYYDEKTNTIYSHVPFDINNTCIALDFVCDKLEEESNFLNINNSSNVKTLNKKIKENEKLLSKEDIKLLSDILNKLYKYKCKNKCKIKTKNSNIVKGDCYSNKNNNKEGGLLWNRNYTSDSFQSIKGTNFVAGHDAQKDNRQIKVKDEKDASGTIVNIDVARGCGNQKIQPITALVEIEKTKDGKIKPTQLPEKTEIKYENRYKDNNNENIENRTIKTINSKIPSELSDGVEFEVEDIDKYTNKSQLLNGIIDNLKNDDFNTFIEYLRVNNYSKSSLEDIFLNDNFKNEVLFTIDTTKKTVVNETFLKKLITNIFDNYLKTYENNINEVAKLRTTIFDILNNKELKLTEEQEKTIETVKRKTTTSLMTIDNMFHKKSNLSDHENYKIILNNCCKYIQHKKFDKEKIIKIVSNDKFKTACCFNSTIEKQPISTNTLKKFFVKPLIDNYKKTNKNMGEIYDFIHMLFEILSSKLDLNEKEKKYFNSSFKKNILKENNFIISKDDLNCRLGHKNRSFIKILDNNLNTTNRQEVIQNTIDLIKKQETQLEKSDERLQKTATLLIILEVYKYYIDKENKFDTISNTYETLSSTVRKKIKNIESLEKINDITLSVTKEIIEELSKTGKESPSNTI